MSPPHPESENWGGDPGRLREQEVLPGRKPLTPQPPYGFSRSDPPGRQPSRAVTCAEMNSRRLLKPLPKSVGWRETRLSGSPGSGRPFEPVTMRPVRESCRWTRPRAGPGVVPPPGRRLSGSGGALGGRVGPARACRARRSCNGPRLRLPSRGCVLATVAAPRALQARAVGTGPWGYTRGARPSPAVTRGTARPCPGGQACQAGLWWVVHGQSWPTPSRATGGPGPVFPLSRGPEGLRSRGSFRRRGRSPARAPTSKLAGPSSRMRHPTASRGSYTSANRRGPRADAVRGTHHSPRAPTGRRGGCCPEAHHSPGADDVRRDAPQPRGGCRPT